MSLLEARGVVFDYDGPLRALDGVDVALAAGELVAVIGPNGSGKSTLVKVLGGLLPPTSGEVRFEGRLQVGLRPRERARGVAVVPQFLPALPEVRVEDFVLSGRYAHIPRFASATAADRDAVRRALDECDAAELADRAMAELSGGQRQRVLVARALAQEAPVLLIDEPTAGLDPEHQIRILELIASLRGLRGLRDGGSASGATGGRAALFVTHDLNLASQYASRVVLLDGGRVAASGPVEAVLRREVLEPVYGEHLHYGTWPSGAGAGRPFVLPRRSEREPARG
jgi:iron complex transport system ATP-binding protein